MLPVNVNQNLEFSQGDEIELIRHWKTRSDVRIVKLLCESKKRLICQVFNKVTQEMSERLLESSQFESTPEYGAYIAQNMHPELSANRKGSVCAAMFVQNNQELIHTWHAGSNGNVEVKIFQPINNQEEEGVCIILDTESNKLKNFLVSREQINLYASYTQSHIPLIEYDTDGCPSSFTFQEYPHAYWHIAHTWALEGKDVQIMRAGDILKYSVISYPDRSIMEGAIPLPNGMPVKSAIAKLITRKPVVEGGESVKFLPLPLEWQSGADGKFRSQLDSEVVVDEDNWAITLVDSVVSTNGNPLLLGGHTSICVEMLEDGEYSLKKVDLICPDDKAVIEFNEKIKIINPNKIASKTITWTRSKEKVQKMLDAIEREKADLDNGRNPIHLDLRGQGALGTSVMAHNCFTWAREKIAIAGIWLYKDPEEIVPDIVIMPRVYISMNSLSSKERVLVHVEGTDFKVDITRRVDKWVNKRPWTLRSDTNGEIPEEIKTRGRVSLTNNEVNIASVWIGLKVKDPNFIFAGMDTAEMVKKEVKKALRLQNVNQMFAVAAKVDQYIVNNIYTREERWELEREMMIGRAPFSRLSANIDIFGKIMAVFFSTILSSQEIAGVIANGTHLLVELIERRSEKALEELD